MVPMSGDSDNGLSRDSDDIRRRKGTLRLVALFRISAYLVMTGLALFAGGFGVFATHVSELTTPRNVSKADAIIVLTGGQARIDAALDLLKAGKGKRLLISGVNPAADRKALQTVTGADRKLFSCCVDIDHEALDTIGNANEISRWIHDHSYRSVLVVTNNYHMPRSLHELRMADPATEFIPYPVINADLSRRAWFTEPDTLRTMLSEYLKVVLATVRDTFGLGRGSGLRTEDDLPRPEAPAPAR